MAVVSSKSGAVFVAAMLLAATQAHAGGKRDLSGYGPAWAGFYVGSHAGIGFANVEVTETIEVPPFAPISISIEEDNTEIVGGLQIGYNLLLSGGTVLGAEADWTFLNGDIGSIRGRVGQVMDDKMFFLTAGLAFADDDAIDSTGFVVGAGVEVDLNHYWHNVTAGVEGLYYGFSDEINCGGFGIACNAEIDASAFVIRGRLNYHFGADDRVLK